MIKILSLDELLIAAAARKADGKKLVHCHGTFDLLHTGHIRHLQRAAEEGDVLIVSLTADTYVNKGPGRPVFTERLRAENLAALECVNYVYINHEKTAVNLIKKLCPDVYVKGGEFRDDNDLSGQIKPERLAIESVGGRLFLTDEVTFSSTQLLNDHFDVFSQDVRQYLDSFKQRYSVEQVLQALQSLDGQRVLVLGDAIIDEYHYISTMGQTGKSSTLAVRYRAQEQFAGGAMAVANHVAGFAGEVTLLTGLGRDRSYEEFIRGKLLSNIAPVFVSYPGETLRKRRYVEHNNSSLFEVYYGIEHPLGADDSARICDWLEANLQHYDVVIVADFGNGLITPDIAEIVAQKAAFLAVNTQVNSMNRGFHVVTRYARADFISLNEPELRMAAREQYGDIEALAERIGDKLNSRFLAVTRGEYGVLCRNFEQRKNHHIPALSSKVVDRIGAGDAFLSLSGLCLGAGMEPDLACFIGSATAALDVQIVCNREPVSPSALFKFVQTLLK